jgi:16S rRNA processing protein RimM
VKTIGRITKTYGFEGAVIVRNEGGITREPEQGEPVFVVIDGIPVPFFTREAWSPSPGTLIISFDDYLTEKSVIGFKGCEVRTGKEDNVKRDPSSLEGYTIIDKNSSFRGVIARVIQNPGQMIAAITSAGGEILIPMHQDLIISVDKKRKLIEMSLPSGLTGIND